FPETSIVVRPRAGDPNNGDEAHETNRAFGLVLGDTAPNDGPYRVADALDDYFKSYGKRGKGVSAARSAANLHIVPALGALPVATLTPKRLRDWHHAIADKPRQARGKRGKPSKNAKLRTPGGDAIRK